MNVRSFADLRAEAARALRARSIPPSARRASASELSASARAAAATTTAWSRSGATSSSTRRSWSAASRPSSATCPREVLRDRARASPEVHPAGRRGGAGRALRRRDQQRRRDGGARSCAAWSGWWWRACATRAFFFAEDRKRPLADRVDDLAGVTFHQGLGTYGDKAERMVRAGGRHGRDAGPARRRPEHEAAREAARLAKADLTTLMVREFPELQGVMGGIYLRAEGAAAASVARGGALALPPALDRGGRAPAGSSGRRRRRRSSPPCRWPTSSTRWPATSASASMPTGSSDPFGLRRAAQGAVRVLLDFWQADRGGARPSLRELVAAAVAGYGGVAEAPGGRRRARPRGVPPRPPALRARRARLRGRRGGGGARRARAGRARRPPRGAGCACGRCTACAREAPRGLRAPGGRLQARQEHPRQQEPAGRGRPGAASRSDAERDLHAAVAQPAARGRRLRGAAALAGRRCARPSTASSTTCS